MGQLRPMLEEINPEVRLRLVGVTVPGGMEHVGLRARTLLHKTGNRRVITDCSYTFDTVKKTVLLTEVTNRAPALTPLVFECYGTKPQAD